MWRSDVVSRPWAWHAGRPRPISRRSRRRSPAASGQSSQAVDAQNDDALALLERVVNINSGTQNLAGVRAVGDVFRAEFDALGFKTRWVDGAALHRAGHLVAEHPGTGPKILLIGHLDTVFEPTVPFQKFERIDATRRRRGPGIIDMKGGDVIIVAGAAGAEGRRRAEDDERDGRDDRRRGRRRAIR